MEAARARLRVSLETGTPDVGALDELPRKEQTALLAELAPNLGGAARRRLAETAGRTGITARAEADCRSRRWSRRSRGIRLLTLVGDGESVVPVLLADASPQLRAAAATWAGDHPLPAVIGSLLGLLEDDDPLCRFAAKGALLRIGQPAVDSLAAHLANTANRRVEEALEVAAALADPRLLEPAMSIAQGRTGRTRALAASIAGSVGGAEAVACLIGMLEDPHADVRAAAARGLGRLGHFPAGPRLLAALRDRAWKVRREAALALATLGAPGILLLRRGLEDHDRFARDMARQALDLPDTGWRMAGA